MTSAADLLERGAARVPLALIGCAPDCGHVDFTSRSAIRSMPAERVGPIPV
ncbi:hypothetical protein [Nonomuraea sp. SBT364]|uniref:hypothetical protein n=1 Tax=Nonomuraea sp. SBT364 TaxID=1580530 RepID=UPI000AB2751E|nr:hypothetical protein [Nonomuraea sp. SBT364]